MGNGAVTPLPPPRGAIKALVFDLDGTLYQDDRLGEEVNQSACRYVAELKGISAAEADLLLTGTRAADGAGGTLSRAVEALGGTLREMHRRFAAEIRPDRLLREDPRVPELLRLLSKRFRLYLYTNNNRDLSGRIMDQIGVAGLFDRVFSIEDFWLPKPDKVLIAAILKEIHCRPEETLFIGDRYQVDLAVPESMGCVIFESRTVEELLTLKELL